MSLDVFYPEDVVRALLAAEQATASALGSGEIETSYARGYGDGYRSALTTLALALGLLDIASYGQTSVFLENLGWGGKSLTTKQSRSRKL
jgi:hypothetical protein